jgi:hypothetical protein
VVRGFGQLRNGWLSPTLGCSALCLLVATFAPRASRHLSDAGWDALSQTAGGDVRNPRRDAHLLQQAQPQRGRLDQVVEKCRFVRGIGSLPPTVPPLASSPGEADNTCTQVDLHHHDMFQRAANSSAVHSHPFVGYTRTRSASATRTHVFRDPRVLLVHSSGADSLGVTTADESGF